MPVKSITITKDVGVTLRICSGPFKKAVPPPGNVAVADFRGKVADADMKTKNDFSKEDVIVYFTKLNGSFEQTIGGNDFKQIAASDPSANSVNAGAIVIADAYQGTKNITVPAPLKNLLSLLRKPSPRQRYRRHS